MVWRPLGEALGAMIVVDLPLVLVDTRHVVGWGRQLQWCRGSVLKDYAQPKQVDSGVIDDGERRRTAA